jgi:uncharacterized protein (TIGR00251 family)
VTPDAPVRPHPEGCAIELHVVPGASRTRIAGVHGGRVKLQVAAPPVDGAANDEVTRFIAELLGVGRGAVRIASGATGRRKSVRIDGVDAATAARAFAMD